MNKVTTYQELLMIERDILKQQMNSIAYCLFNDKKIKDFHQLNALPLKVANEKLDAMMKSHIAVDENGKFKSVLDEKGIRTFVGKTADDQRLYQEEYDELMKRNVTILA